jgi:2-oxoglutarate dehydrogenase E2 component (dihydrolipoamide succinyltransferase)
MAAEHNIELASLQGSGIAGRVTKRDIVGLIESGVPAAAPAGANGGTTAPAAAAPVPGASMHAPGGVDPHLPMPEPWAGDVVEPMSKMRALISDHMVASRRTSAHVTSFFEVDFTRVARLRAKHRASFEASTGQKLTYMPFIIKSVVDGLKKFPIMNSSVAGANVIYRKQVNIGIAVALDWGLIVPSSRTRTTSRSPGSRARSTISPPARAPRSCRPPRCRTARSRSPTPACSAPSWARRSSTSRRSRSWAWARSRSGRR